MAVCRYVRLAARLAARARWMGGWTPWHLHLGALGSSERATERACLPCAGHCWLLCGAQCGRGWLGCMRRLRRTGDLGLAAVDVAHDEDKLARE